MMASFSRHTSSRKSAPAALAFDTSTVRSFAAGSYGIVSTILNGRPRRGRSASIALALAWPKVSLTCMNTAVRGAVPVARKSSRINDRPLVTSSGAVGKSLNTNW